MEQREPQFSRKWLFGATVVVLSHFAVVLYHLRLLVKVQPGMPAPALIALIVINLVPVMGLIAFGKGRPKPAGWMIMVPLSLALIIGSYAHFLSAGTDNVFRMPPGQWRLSFQVTSVLLAVLEAMGCWIGVHLLVWSQTESTEIN